MAVLPPSHFTISSQVIRYRKRSRHRWNNILSAHFRPFQYLAFRTFLWEFCPERGLLCLKLEVPKCRRYLKKHWTNLMGFSNYLFCSFHYRPRSIRAPFWSCECEKVAAMAYFVLLYYESINCTTFCRLQFLMVFLFHYLNTSYYINKRESIFKDYSYHLDSAI